MAITPTIFGRPSSTLGGLCYYSRFTAATTILLSSFLVHHSTTVTGMLSSILHHLHHNFIVVFRSLPHCHGYIVYPPPPHLYGYVVFSSPYTISTKKLQKSCLGAVNPVTVLPKVLVYFVFYFYTDTIEDVVFLWS